MASPKADSTGESPRDGVTKQNISAGSSPAGDLIIAQVQSTKEQFVRSHISNVFIRMRLKEMPATRHLEMMRQCRPGPKKHQLTITYRESSTASISSSILEYRKFQGRTFHSERYNTEYFTPNDEQQRDSIDIT
jgi:hypothetical protein